MRQHLPVPGLLLRLVAGGLLVGRATGTPGGCGRRDLGAVCAVARGGL